MSTTIDEKVVEMRFDNKQFEQNVATSMSTLDKLKKSLDLDGAVKGFDNLGDAAKKCNVSTLGQAAEEISSKFSVLETIAVGALLKIGSQAVTVGEQLLKSLTVDQISAGWEKYSDKTTAVQTIMAATGKSIDEVNGSLEKLIWFTDETSYSMTDMTSNIGKFTSQGIELDTAVTAMEGISTWASLSGGSIAEASRAMYNLSQALGVGAVKLQDWKSIENANMATKEFKEMAMEAAAATGDLIKSFDDAGNAIYKTSKGTEVTAANFSTTLSEAWFTSDALISVLNNYGSYADGVYELYNNLGDGVEKTTSEIISDLKKLQGADDQTILNAGYTEDQIELVRQLAEEVGGIGQKSFAAAQEAKTFEEVITSVKEAVASGWSQTFETIFGNYEEAKVLWTDLANALYDVFAEGGNVRNELLTEALSFSGFDRFISNLEDLGIEADVFHEKLSAVAEDKGLSLNGIIAEYGTLEEAVQNGAVSYDLLRDAAMQCGEEVEGLSFTQLSQTLDLTLHSVDALSGRQHLISAFWNAWEGVGTLLSTVKEAFRDIFPETTAEQIYAFVEGLNNLTDRFKTFLSESEEGQSLLTNIKNTFTGIFSVVDLVKEAFSALWRALEPARTATGGLLTNIFGLSSSFGEWLTNLTQTVKENDTFYNGFQKIVTYIQGAISTVKEFISALREKWSIPNLFEAAENIKTFFQESEKGQRILTDLRNTFKGVFAIVDIVKEAFSALWRSLEPARSAAGGLFSNILSGIGNLLTNILGLTGSFGEWLTNLAQTIKENDTFYNGIQKVIGGVKSAISAVKGFGASLREKWNIPSLSELAESIKNFLATVKERFATPGLELLKSIFESLKTRADQVKDAIMSMKDGVVNAFDKIDTAVVGSKFIQILNGIWTVIKSIGSAIGNFLSNAFSGLISMLKNADFDGIIDFLNVLATGGIVVGIKKLLNVGNELSDSVGGFFDWIKNFGQGITNILDGVRGCLEAYQNNLKASALLKIAGAVALLAAALLVLSTIDSEKLQGSLAAVTTLFIELMGAMAVMDKLNIDAKSMNKTSTAMIKIGAALLILSIAMKNLGELEPEQLAEGLIGVGVLLAEIAAFLKVADFESGATKTATGMVIFAAAIKILASVVKDFASLSWEEMAKGLVGVGVLLAEIDVFLNTAKFSAKSVLTATGIVILAGAIKILASAVKDFAGLSWEEIAKGLASIGTLLAEIAAFTNLTGNAEHVIATGLALIEIGAAMKIFASAMQSFAGMSWEEIAKGLVAMGGALAEVAIAANLMPDNMVSLGVGLIAVGAALKIITSVLGTMGGMSWEEIAKGLVTLGGALAELAIALNLMDGTLGGSAALLVAAGAIAILTPSLKALGNMSWESIAKGLVTIAGAFAIIGVAAAVLSPLTVTILALSAALAIIGVGSVAIGAGLILIGTGLTGVSVGLTALAAAMAASVSAIMEGLSTIILGLANLIPAVAEKIGEGIVVFCETIANSAPAIAEAIKAVVIALVDMLVTCVPTIADGALQLIVGVLDALVTYTPQIIDAVMQFLIEVIEGVANNLPQLIQAVMDLVGAFFAGILDAFNNIEVGDLIQGIEAIGLLTGIVAALGLIAGMIPEAMIGALGLGAVVAELALILAAIGELSQIPGLEWLISEGGHLLETIGDAIGGFVGGIVGGFLGGVSSAFPQVGADLSAFMTNIQPFIDGASGISSDLLSGIANLTGAILLITAADLLEGLTSWLTGGSSLADFGNELVPFGESMIAFSNSISGLDADLINKAATAGKALAEMASTLPNSGGVVGFFAGNNDMDEFGKQLVVFGAAMALFGMTVRGLDTDAVQNAAIAGKTMAEMASTLPNTGGAVAFFAGDNDMVTFGEQLVPFGKAIKEYSEAVTGLDVDAVTNSAIAGAALVELADTVPNTGGVVAFFAGDNDLATFGTQIVVFGESMKLYSEAVAGLDGEAITNSAVAGAALVELADTVPNTGGLVSFFTGDNDLATFGEQLVPFGQAMAEYSNAVAGMDTEAVTTSATAAQALAELQSTLPNVGGVVDFFTGGNDLGTFGEGIKIFGEAMKSYGDAVAGMDTEAVTASATAALALSQLQNSLPNVGGFVSLFTGDNDLATFAQGLIPFGEAMKSYGEAVSGIDTDAINASAIAAQSLNTLQSTLPNVGGVVEFFTGGNDLGKFAEGLIPFGEAMKSYSDAVVGLDTEAVSASASAAQSLSELQATLPNVGGVMEFFTGGNDLGTFASGIIPFGKAMKTYGDAVAGIDTASISASAIAAQSLAELQSTLPTVGGVMEFFTGGNDLGTFAAGIIPFGKAMHSYGAAVSGIDTESIGASAVAAQSLAELQATLPNVGGVIDFFTGGNDLATFGETLIPFGKAMHDYSTAVAGINTIAVRASANAGKSLVELANTLPNCDGLVQVFTGSNNLASFGGDIVVFGQDLANYASAIEDVKPEVVSASANAAQALSDLATGLPDSSLFDKWFGGDQTLASFGDDIAVFGANMSDYYSKVATVDVSKLASVISEVWSIVDLAKGLQDFDTSGMAGFGQALKEIANDTLNNFIGVFDSGSDQVTAAIQRMLETVSNAITENKNLATTGMQDVMAALFNVVSSKASDISNSVKTMMTGVANTITNNTNTAKSAMQTVMSSIVSTINSYYNSFYSSGSYVVQGFVEGISSKTYLAANAGYALGRAALNAAKQALDSHSPSREFIYLGEHIGEGLAIGINNGIVPAVQATSDLIEEVLEVASTDIDTWKEWLEEKKYYSEISLKDELAGWEELQKQYIEGSEERIKIDREVYRVQNELVAATYQYSIDWIEQQKYYNLLSTEEEIAAYERMQSRYMKGSTQRIEIDKKLYSLRNQLVEESYQAELDWIEEEKYYNRLSTEEELKLYEKMLTEYEEGSEYRIELEKKVYTTSNQLMEEYYQNAMDWIDEMQYYGKMSLIEELVAYKQIQKQYAKGSENYKKMAKEAYRVEKEIYEAKKQYEADVQQVQEDAAQKRLDLEQEYADKVTSINEKLASDIQNLTDQYESALSSRESSLYKSYGLFDEVAEREEVSGQQLLNNLQGQVEEFNEWQNTISQLSARGVDSELIAELEEMGPSAIAQIKALVSLSDSELDRYVGLWAVKHAQAKSQAVSELESLRIETQNNIAQLRVDADAELEDYRVLWQQKMDQIDIDANAELEQLRKDYEEKIGLIKDDTEAETQEMVDAVQQILEEAGWGEVGKQIVEDLTDGVESEIPVFLRTLTQMAADGASAVQSVFSSGVSNNLDISGLSDATGTLSDYLNGNLESLPSVRPVVDISEIAAEVRATMPTFQNSASNTLANDAGSAFAASSNPVGVAASIDIDEVVRQLEALRSDVNTMTDSVSNMQIVMDTGVLVGQTASAMDSRLGQMQAYSKRGN